MTKRDWNRAAQRDRIARQGTEARADEDLAASVLRQSPHRPLTPRPSKAAMRRDLERLSGRATVKRLVKCPCGHSATLELRADRVGKVRLRCSRCDRKLEV